MYNFTLLVADFSSSIFAQVLGETAGDSIMRGKSAQDLRALIDIREDDYAA